MTKKELTQDFIDFMLLKSNRMFKWENLPDTIPDYVIEKYLQEYGKCIFYKYNGNYYIFDFSFCGLPDVYNKPSEILFTNVALNITIQESKNIENETQNGIIIFNDNKMKSLIPIYKKYGELLAESETSLKIITQLDRMKSFITASDDKTKNDCRNFIQKIVNGELSIIGDNALYESVKMFNSNTSSNSISQYIELIQYLKASCFNEIGINSNYNMKRERINESEIQLNDFGLLPLCNLMLECRQKAVEKINEKFNLNIKVSLNDIWELEKISIAKTLTDINTEKTDTIKEVQKETETETETDTEVQETETDTETEVQETDTETQESGVEKNDNE